MAIKKYNPTSPARRFMTVSDFAEITKKTPERSLLAKKQKNAGRNSYGRITVRHRGGGNKQKYRIIDFKRQKDGMTVTSGEGADVKVGNALFIKDIPVGTLIHNLEIHPGKGGQLVRSAGESAQLMAKENGYGQVRLPSGEVRLVALNCKATIGSVGNQQHENISIGKAGRKRHMGWRPTVRGVVMNPNDHPHGGGEGKSPIGRPAPVTPWGKPALGLRTRKPKNRTNKFIVKRRNDK